MVNVPSPLISVIFFGHRSPEVTDLAMRYVVIFFRPFEAELVEHPMRLVR